MSANELRAFGDCTVVTICIIHIDVLNSIDIIMISLHRWFETGCKHSMLT
jgi:hypothetical protein